MNPNNLKKYLTRNNGQGIFFETAHPVKFLDVIEPIIKETIELPEQILKIIDKEKVAISISTYKDLKNFLLNP